MDIKTKFELEQEVFFLHDRKIKTAFVKNLEIIYSSKGKGFGYNKTENYIVSFDGILDKIPASDLFETKQELLNSL